MAFEVASVKPAQPGTSIVSTVPLFQGDAKPPGGRLQANFFLAAYIGFAYKIDTSEFKAMNEQLPSWANDLYLIDAEADGNPTKDQMRLMIAVAACRPVQAKGSF